MVIVSHDRELLALVDQVADLSGGSVRMYGGNLDAYEALLAAEQDAAARAVSAAVADVRREKRDLVASQVKQARRDRQGRKAAQSLPPILANARKRSAQETAGKNRQLHAGRLAAAHERLTSAEEAVREDAEIRVDLPGTGVPAGRTVLTVDGLGDGAWPPHPPAREASGSARCWPACCSRPRRRSCCCSTSRPTTWTSLRRGNSPRRWTATRGRCSS
jgi:ATPase subunit of ABC transporter with duplicated ATPase domains